MLHSLSSYLISLGAKASITKPWIFKVFSYLISLPLIGQAYEYFYSKKIQKIITHYESSPGYQVALEPLNVCNIECTMCPYPDMEREKTLMPMDLYKKIIDGVVAFGYTRLNLTHYNEPFLDKNLFERVRYAKTKKRENSTESSRLVSFLIVFQVVRMMELLWPVMIRNG